MFALPRALAAIPFANSISFITLLCCVLGFSQPLKAAASAGLDLSSNFSPSLSSGLSPSLSPSLGSAMAGASIENTETPAPCTQCYDFNTRCRQAYDLIFALRIKEGLALLEAEKRENPGNRLPWFLENYADFFVCYIGEERSEFDKREPNKERRLRELSKGDKSSPYYRYTEAELHLQWALARLKFEEYLSAFREIRKAYLLLQENQRLFPDFKPTAKSLALLHAIIGAIPDQYQWGARMVGLDGDIDQGMGEMRALLRWSSSNDFVFEQEALVYYALMSLYLENDPESAWETVSTDRLALRGNLLNHFITASVAMRTGRNDEAIRLLTNAPRTSEYLSFAYLDFMLGLAKLRRLDGDAHLSLEKFLVGFKGRNYVRECYQKLAWHHLVQGRPERYTEYMILCKQRGVSIIDDDKQAEKEAQRGAAPNALLLKTRLLFDGGYYKRALQGLEGKKMEQFQTPAEQVEFTYRAGRIYDEAGMPEQAKGFYQAALQNGETLPYYYAASAALHLGYLYEQEGNEEKAAAYFRRSLKMKDHEYRNSLQSKAKAGLNRVGG